MFYSVRMAREIRGASENDAFTRWGRRYLIYIQRAGVRRSIKTSANRRERHAARRALRDPDAG